MKTVKFSLIPLLTLGLAGLASTASATPITINMTGDNFITDGGLCTDASCTSGTGWFELNGNADLAEGNNWRESDTLVLDLGLGTHYFAWEVTNDVSVLAAGEANPAGLLAEILWDGGANYSSDAWEIFDSEFGTFLEFATVYGSNADPSLWWAMNRTGSVTGISGLANWIYGSENFSVDTPVSQWIRTSITIVPEPGTLVIFGLGLLGLGATTQRRRRAA